MPGLSSGAGALAAKIHVRGGRARARRRPHLLRHGQAVHRQDGARLTSLSSWGEDYRARRPPRPRSSPRRRAAKRVGSLGRATPRSRRRSSSSPGCSPRIRRVMGEVEEEGRPAHVPRVRPRQLRARRPDRTRSRGCSGAAATSRRFSEGSGAAPREAGRALVLAVRLTRWRSRDGCEPPRARGLGSHWSPAGQAPVVVAEQLHRGGQEHAADDRCVDEHCGREVMPSPSGR